ncbi:class I adenylate-forming enzyme family protein [Thiolapillus sp.]
MEYRGECYSSGRLEQLLNALALHLQARGVKPGMVVASVGGQRWLNALLLFALPRMGCVFFPVDPALPERSRQQLLRAGRAGLVLADDCCLEKPNAESASHLSGRELEPNAVHLLLATSGTQGQPRIVELTGRNLAASVLASCKRLDLKEGDAWLACLPLHHIGGLGILLRCAHAGAKVVLVDRGDPLILRGALAQGRVSHLSLVPTMLHRLLEVDSGFRPPAALKAVVLGGASATPALVEAALKLGWPLCPSYGLTEAASQVATLFPSPRQWQPGCAGLPLEHVEIAVCKDSNVVFVRGASVATYARCVDGSLLKLTDEQGWLNTRDLGRLDGRGQLYIFGRDDDVLVSGGENVHPQLLEQELLCCPGVEQIAVTALQDAIWGDALVALYCGSASVEQVADWARWNLQGVFVPKRFIKADALPRNAMGKLLRAEVKRLVQRLLQGE